MDATPRLERADFLRILLAEYWAADKFRPSSQTPDLRMLGAMIDVTLDWLTEPERERDLEIAAEETARIWVRECEERMESLAASVMDLRNELAVLLALRKSDSSDPSNSLRAAFYRNAAAVDARLAAPLEEASAPADACTTGPVSSESAQGGAEGAGRSCAACHGKSDPFALTPQDAGCQRCAGTGIEPEAAPELFRAPHTVRCAPIETSAPPDHPASRTGRVARSLEETPCTCGRTDGTHHFGNKVQKRCPKWSWLNNRGYRNEQEYRTALDGLATDIEAALQPQIESAAVAPDLPDVDTIQEGMAPEPTAAARPPAMTEAEFALHKATRNARRYIVNCLNAHANPQEIEVRNALRFSGAQYSDAQIEAFIAEVRTEWENR